MTPTIPVFSLSAAVSENRPKGFLPNPTMYFVKGSPIGIGEGCWVGSVAAEVMVSNSPALSVVRVRVSVSPSPSAVSVAVSSASSPAPSLLARSSVVAACAVTVVVIGQCDSSLTRLALNKSL